MVDMTFKDEVEKIVETLLVRPLNTPGAVAETNKLTQALSDLHESEVLKTQLRLIDYYDQIPSNDVMDWKGLFADNRKDLEYKLKALTTNTGGQE